MSLRGMLEALSSLARTGWMLRGVPAVLAEDVARHSFWAAILAYEIGSGLRSRGVEVSAERAAVIALYHDVAESVVGDIAKVSGVSEEEKVSAEIRAVRSLPISEESRGLFMEFESAGTLEARVAKVAEMLATYLKAVSYVERGFDVRDIRDNMLRRIEEALPGIGLDGVGDLCRLVPGLASDLCVESSSD